MPRKTTAKAVRRIEDDTPILPHIVADAVISEVDRCVSLDLSASEERDLADRLAEHADAVYARNERFRRKIRARGDAGRDALYAFMRHWLASELKKIRPRVFAQLPQRFLVGEELDCDAVRRGSPVAHARKKASREKVAPSPPFPLGPPRSKAATVIVYSRPSGYWYAQARDATTGAPITDASGYSREDVLRTLRGKFPMIGVAIESIADEDPYAVGPSIHHAKKKTSPAQLDREIAEAISKRGYYPRAGAASFAELHRRTSREIDRDLLNRALGEIYDATHVVAAGPKIYMYGSKDDAQEFIRGLPRYAEGHPLEVRSITSKEQQDLARHKRQAYRNP